MSKKIHIRNMVCDRCIAAVRGLLDRHDLSYTSVLMGEVDLVDPLGKDQRSELAEGLSQLGFELIDDKRTRVIEKVKGVIREVVRNPEAIKGERLSVHLAAELGMAYSGLSELFSAVEGITIERYHILQRLERAKELLVYDELSLSQIADELGFSSVHHLSAQFTKFIGSTPSHFKRIGAARRKPLDKV